MKVIFEVKDWLMAVDDGIDVNNSELIFKKCTIIKLNEKTYIPSQTIGSWLNHVPYWTNPTRKYTSAEINEMLETFEKLP